MLNAKHAVAIVALSVALTSCTKKDDPTKPAGSSASGTTAAPATGDGGSMAGPLALALGKPVEGTLGCLGPPWFLLVNVPAGAEVKYELKVPPGAPQYCTHLNARDATGKLADSTLTLCSDDPKAFAVKQGPIYGEPRFFTIDKNDQNDPCVNAQYRLTLVKK